MSIKDVFVKLSDEAGFSMYEKKKNHLQFAKRTSRFVVQNIVLGQVFDKSSWHVTFSVGVDVAPAIMFFLENKSEIPDDVINDFLGYFIQVYSVELDPHGCVRSQGYPGVQIYLDTDGQKFETDFLYTIVPWLKKRSDPDALLNVMKSDGNYFNEDRFVIKYQRKFIHSLSFFGINRKDTVISNVCLRRDSPAGKCVMGALMLEIGQEDTAKEMILEYVKNNPRRLNGA